MAQAKRKTPERIDPLISRERLLDEYQVTTMEGLATLLDVDVKTLQNRDASDLPPYSKVGGKRLFFKDDVIAWLRKRMNRH